MFFTRAVTPGFALSLACLFGSTLIAEAQSVPWQRIATHQLRLDRAELERQLAKAPSEFGSGNDALLSLPLPDGSLARFRVRESPILGPEMARLHPEIHTYSAIGADDSTLRGRLDMTKAGFHAALFGKDGLFFIEPTTDGGYASSNVHGRTVQKAACGVTQTLAVKSKAASHAATVDIPVSLDQLRTFRLVVATTAEFAKAATINNDPDGSIVTILNTTNAVYERDMSVHFQLVKTLVFTDAATQPFDDTKAAPALDINQKLIDDKVGSAGYDVGHVFANNAGTGLGVSGLCEAGVKGQGISTLGTYSLQEFAVEQVAHEIGHQLGANHTFNGNNGSACKDTNRNLPSAFEVGSGATIMSYAGICGSDDNSQDLDTLSNGFFHAFNIKEMNDIVRAQNSCQQPITTTEKNSAPQIVPLPAGLVIPAQTPFALTALVTDPDARDQKNLTYSWEEMDLGGASPPDDDDGKRSLFRNYKPFSAPLRYFPSIQFILNNQNNPPLNYTNDKGRKLLTGEAQANTTRTMTFRLAVRDNRVSNGATSGSTVFADTTISVSNAAGPFVVTAPNTAVSWVAGAPETITWNVAKTDQDPVNEKTVRIKLSTDGGQTFPYILASNVPNNGTASVTVPAGIPATSKARIMVAAEKSIFLDVSDADFNITAASTGATSPQISPGGIISAAGLQPTVAPGSVISIYGANMAAAASGAAAVPLPATLGDVSVTINGTAAPLFYVSAGQINAQVPYEAPVGEAVVVVTSHGVATAGAPLQVSATAPGVLQFGTSRAVVVNPDGSVNNTGAGAKPGAVVVAYMTGQGAVDGAVTTGAASAGSPLLNTKAATSITVGGQPATLLFSGLTPGGVGLMQLNFTIPALPAGDYPLVVTVGGVSSNALTISVSQ